MMRETLHVVSVSKITGKCILDKCLFCPSTRGGMMNVIPWVDLFGDGVLWVLGGDNSD